MSEPQFTCRICGGRFGLKDVIYWDGTGSDGYYCRACDRKAPNQPRYTREEWEEIENREFEASMAEARESPDGFFSYNLMISNAEFRRQMSREAFEDLLRVKLEQVRLRVLEAFYGDE